MKNMGMFHKNKSTYLQNPLNIPEQKLFINEGPTVTLWKLTDIAVCYFCISQ